MTTVHVTPAAEQLLLELVGWKRHPCPTLTAEYDRLRKELRVNFRDAIGADLDQSFNMGWLARDAGFSLTAEVEPCRIVSAVEAAKYVDPTTTYTLDAEVPTQYVEGRSPQKHGKTTGEMLQQTAATAGVTPEELTAFVKVYGSPKQGKMLKVGDLVEFKCGQDDRANPIMGVAMGEPETAEDGTVQVAVMPGVFKVDVDAAAKSLTRVMDALAEDNPMAWLDERVEDICKLGRLQ